MWRSPSREVVKRHLRQTLSEDLEVARMCAGLRILFGWQASGGGDVTFANEFRCRGNTSQAHIGSEAGAGMQEATTLLPSSRKQQH